jgi:hypothetical protein
MLRGQSSEAVMLFLWYAGRETPEACTETVSGVSGSDRQGNQVETPGTSLFCILQ